jgi:ADP-ribosylglycohydrolase
MATPDPIPPAAVEDRALGALVGLAVGDALGAAVEFKSPGTFPPVTGYRAGGPHGLAPGEWTDDTSMALALADSLATAGFDPADQGRRYLAWWRKGTYSVNGRCFDIGVTTRHALARIADGIRAERAGSAADESSGNGSIMRLAPIALRYGGLLASNPAALATYAARSSAVTHRSDKCLSACRYLALVLAALIDGQPREEVLAPTWPVLLDLHAREPLDPAVLEVARGSFRQKSPPDVRGDGYVVRSLEAALWAFHSAASFEQAVLAAVNLGEDADTTGAVCGQLAGAFFGASAIPAPLREGLARRELIEAAARRLRAPSLPHWTLATEGVKPPATRCYWVVPGQLLAGAYAGHVEAPAHEARVKSLWDAGIRTFVSLMEQEERDSAGQAFRVYADAVAELSARDGEPASLLRFAIRDVSIPTRDTMTRALDAIDASLAAGRPVYVHCFGGVGRTGTVVGCWLLRHGLATREDFLRVIAELRRADVERKDRASPQTSEQVGFVASWSERTERTERNE